MALYRGYQGAKSCTDGPTDGAKALMAWFLAAYGDKGGYNLGIYNCRSVRGGSTTSVHGEGRAADLGIDKPRKRWTRLANRLRRNSKELGIQCIIYNRRIWSGAYPTAGWRHYSGANPHTNHLHVELSWNAARNLTTAKIGDQLAGSRSGSSKGSNVKLPKAPKYSLPDGHYFGPSRGIRSHGGRGHHRDDLRKWQARMRRRGWHIVADGLYGPQTNHVTRQFQRQKGLVVDGLIGPKTWAAAWTMPIT